MIRRMSLRQTNHAGTVGFQIKFRSQFAIRIEGRLNEDPELLALRCVYDRAAGRQSAGRGAGCERSGHAAMQAIAREFNLSENGVRAAGGQSAGTAQPHPHFHARLSKCRLPAIRRSARRLRLPNCPARADAGIFVLEENIGPVRCAVSKHDGASFAEFDLAETAGAAGASGRSGGDRRSTRPGAARDRLREPPRRVLVGGVPYVTIPVADLEAAAEGELDNRLWSELAPRKSEWVRQPLRLLPRAVNHESAFHVRMIVPGRPSYEDPATGSAAAAFAGAIMHFDQPDGWLFAAVDRAGAGDGPAVAHPAGTGRGKAAS